MAYYIRLVDRDSNDFVELGIMPSKMSLDYLQAYILEQFKGSNGTSRSVVGVFDDEMRIFYPLSFLLHSPRTFATRQQDFFSIVYDDSSFMNETTNTTQSAQQVIDHYAEEDEEDEEDDDDAYVSETSNETDSRIVSSSSNGGPSRSFNDIFLANVPVEFIDAHLKMLLDEAAARTMFKNYTISQVFHAMSLYADTSDRISEEGFLASIAYLDIANHDSSDVEGEGGYTTYERMFNAIKEFSMTEEDDEEEEKGELRRDQSMNMYRLCLFLSLFCAIGNNESDHETSLKIIYNLFDFNRDGFVTLSDVHNCFYMLVKSMLNLFPDVIFDIDDYPIEKVVSVLTESLFRGKQLANGGNTILHFAYFQQWYRSRDQMVYMLVEAVPNPMMLRGKLSSKVSSFYEARSNLGLEGILPQTLMKCLSHYASEKCGEIENKNTTDEASNDQNDEDDDEFQFISRRGVFSAILLASKMESANNVFSADWQGLYNAEVIVCQIFALYDISQAGYVDKNDIFAGLSVFCGESFSHRVQTMFNCTDNNYGKFQQIMYVPNGCSFFQTYVNRNQMIEYLLAILKAVLLFGDYDLDEAIIQNLAVRMVSDAIAQKTLPVQLNGTVSTSAFSSWLEIVINIKEETVGNSGYGGEGGGGDEVDTRGRSGNNVSSTGYNSSDGEEEEEEEEEEEKEEGDYSDDDDESQSQTHSEPAEETTVAQELQAVKQMMGFTGFTAEDVLDLLGEVSREGMISEFNWFQAVSNMCAFNTLEGEDDRMDEALMFADKIFNCLAALYPTIVSETNERLVNYSLLLSTITILCDSPVEDKMFTAFMMLSDSTVGNRVNADLGEPDDVTTFASVSNVTDYFRGVFSLLCAVSPTVQELTASMKLTPDAMAIATLQCTMAQNGFTYLPDRGFDIDQFSALAWACMDNM